MATLQELQEMRTRRLQEPPIPQVQAANPKAPDTTPKLPNEIVTNPEDTQAGMSAPKMSDYQFNQNFYKQYMQKPVTQEEEDRRKRAAQSAQAIAGLGNVISAFSNLAFSGEAPSQTLPQLPQVDYLSFSDRLKQQRDQYGAGLINARARDYSEYQNALNSYLNDQYRKSQIDIRQKEHERQMEKDANQLAMDAEKMRLDREKNDFDRAYKTASLAQKDRQLAIDEANAKSLQEYRKSKIEGGADSKDITVIGQNGKEFNVPKSKQDGFFGYAYRRMLDYANKNTDGKKEVYDVGWQVGEGGDQKSKQAAIVLSNIQNFPELYDEFDKVLKTGEFEKKIGWNDNDNNTGNNNGKKIGW